MNDYKKLRLNLYRHGIYRIIWIKEYNGFIDVFIAGTIEPVLFMLRERPQGEQIQIIYNDDKEPHIRHNGFNYITSNLIRCRHHFDIIWNKDTLMYMAAAMKKEIRCGYIAFEEAVFGIVFKSGWNAQYNTGSRCVTFIDGTGMTVEPVQYCFGCK